MQLNNSLLTPAQLVAFLRGAIRMSFYDIGVFLFFSGRHHAVIS